MSTFNGTSFVLYELGTPNKRIADTRDISFSRSVAEIDVSTRDSNGNKEVIGGQRSYTVSATGIIDMTADTAETSVIDLLALAEARTLMPFVAGTGVATDTKFSGTFLVTNVDFATPYEGECTWTMSGTGSGAFTTATGAVS